MSTKPRVSFSVGTLTESELTDLENAQSHAVTHQPVPVNSTLPGTAEVAETEEPARQGGLTENKKMRQHQNTQQQLELYETLENDSKLLTSGPSHALWDKWQQLDTVRPAIAQPLATHPLRAA
eukprot:COSAG02_NODE_1333_length_13206_cov_221.257801_15_plen_123_part_00